MKVKRKFSAQDPGVVRAASGTFLNQVDRGMWLWDFGNLPSGHAHISTVSLQAKILEWIGNWLHLNKKASALRRALVVIHTLFFLSFRHLF